MDQIYRCRDGHLYVASLGKSSLLSIHLGNLHFQRCPVDHRWRTAARVEASHLSEAQLEEAAKHRF